MDLEIYTTPSWYSAFYFQYGFFPKMWLEAQGMGLVWGLKMWFFFYLYHDNEIVEKLNWTETLWHAKDALKACETEAGCY